jgi:hypothetical protein
MMINVDVSATDFISSGPLPDVAAKILGRRSVDDIQRGLSEREVLNI